MYKRLVLLLGLLLLISSITSCGSPTSSTTIPPKPTATSKAKLDDSFLGGVSQVAQAASNTFYTPLDSTPDGSGNTIYFTANGPHGRGVFRVSATGGAVTQVYAGSPFVAPRGIAMSPDGTTMVVADPQAGRGGELFTLPTVGGTPAPVEGSQGSAPQNLNTMSEQGQSKIVFTGKDARSGRPAVMTLPLQGAQAPMVVSEGDALSAPDGVVITPSGTIYVADQAAGKIFKITNNTISVLLNQVRTGNPAGIALSPDADTLLISAHQVTNAYDQVLLLDLNTLQTGSVTSVVGKNAGAAGLHASPLHKDILSWDDSSAGPNGPSATGGKVYVLKLSR